MIVDLWAANTKLVRNPSVVSDAPRSTGPTCTH